MHPAEAISAHCPPQHALAIERKRPTMRRPELHPLAHVDLEDIHADVLEALQQLVGRASRSCSWRPLTRRADTSGERVDVDLAPWLRVLRDARRAHGRAGATARRATPGAVARALVFGREPLRAREHRGSGRRSLALVTARDASQGAGNTTTGANLSSVVPSPTAPEELLPQHTTSPFARRAHACRPPASTSATSDSPRTRVGTSR